MTREEMLAELRTKLGTTVLEWRQLSAKRVYVTVNPEKIREVTELFFRGMGARFQIATGVDTPTAIEILYHWAFDWNGCVVTVVVKLDRQAPTIDSIAGIFKGANWIEREIWELLGVQFRNHPDMRQLLLTEEWDGKYPMRRDYRK